MPKQTPTDPTEQNDSFALPVPNSAVEAPLPPVTILLVDDVPANLQALEAILSPLGHTLLTAQSGEDALRLLLKQDVTLILLDVRMPGIDGFETARLVRQRRESEHTPIVFVTAHEDAQERVLEGYALGAVDFVLKPIISEILKAKVAVLVDLFRKTEQLKQQAERLLADEQRRQRELANLEALSAPETVGSAARLLEPQPPLREGVPEQFRSAVDRFAEALELSLKQTAYRVDVDPVAPLRATSEELGRLRATPRDVVDIYTTAVKEKAQNATPQKARAYLEESRLLALQLMGYVTLYYRNSGALSEQS